MPFAAAARTPCTQVVLAYPEDAKEISWQNGQPVHRPYRGPSQLRFEQDFPADYDIRLAVTSWAKAHFEVLHGGYTVDAAWAADAAAVESMEAAAEAAAAGEAELLLPHLQHAAAAAAAEAAGPGPLAQLPTEHAPHLQQMVAGAVAAAAQHAGHFGGAAASGPLPSDAAAPVGVVAAAAPSAPPPATRLLGAVLAAPPLQPHLEAHPPASLLAGVAAALELGAAREQQRPAGPPEVVDEAQAPGRAVACSVADAPALCPAPSVELFEDGHLPASSQG
jgi:hypothetical protein